MMRYGDRLHTGAPPAWVFQAICFTAGVMAGWAWHLYWVSSR